MTRPNGEAHTFVLTYNGSNPQSQLPTTGSKWEEEFLINRPVARNLIEIRTSVQRGGSDTGVFLGREFLINREVPSSAYLERASVAVDADWQRPSRDGLEVMCHSAYPSEMPTVRWWSTSPESIQLPLIRHYDVGGRPRGGREKGEGRRKNPPESQVRSIPRKRSRRRKDWT